MPPGSFWTIRKLPKTDLHGRSIRDLINGRARRRSNKKNSSHFHPILPHPPRQSVAESSICVFFTRILAAAHERTWTRFLAWAAAAGFDQRGLHFPTALEAYRFLGEGKNAASLKQIRAALSFAYKHWDLKNPFAKIEPPLQNEPQIRYLLLVPAGSGSNTRPPTNRGCIAKDLAKSRRASCGLLSRDHRLLRTSAS
jgi:hypothetical protein